MKRNITLAVIIFLIVSGIFSGCISTETETELVGVLLPTKSLQRWNQDGDNIKMMLEERGYEVGLYYADNDVAQQLNQFLDFLEKGARIIVIAAVDGSALSGYLEDIDHEKVTVIAYDRMLMDTDAVDYYTSFDSEQIGRMQAEYIVESLNLDEDGQDSYNIEVFTGSPDDDNSRLLNKGAMEVLIPYIESGRLIVKSDLGTSHEDWMKIGVMEWDSLGAQSRMETLLEDYYTDESVDAVLSPNDSLAAGIIHALEKDGYGASGKPFPIITGQDCDIENVKYIIEGRQSMSVFKDTRQLAKATVNIADSIITGSEIPINEMRTNNYKDVPSYLIDATLADRQNYEKVLVESGYYTPDQLK